MLLSCNYSVNSSRLLKYNEFNYWYIKCAMWSVRNCLSMKSWRAEEHYNCENMAFREIYRSMSYNRSVYYAFEYEYHYIHILVFICVQCGSKLHNSILRLTLNYRIGFYGNHNWCDMLAQLAVNPRQSYLIPKISIPSYVQLIFGMFLIFWLKVFEATIYYMMQEIFFPSNID